jgi:hypothetical protein
MERIMVLSDAKKLKFPERFQRELPDEVSRKHSQFSDLFPDRATR